MSTHSHIQEVERASCELGEMMERVGEVEREKEEVEKKARERVGERERELEGVREEMAKKEVEVGELRKGFEQEMERLKTYQSNVVRIINSHKINETHTHTQTSSALNIVHSKQHTYVQYTYSTYTYSTHIRYIMHII